SSLYLLCPVFRTLLPFSIPHTILYQSLFFFIYHAFFRDIFSLTITISRKASIDNPKPFSIPSYTRAIFIRTISISASLNGTQVSASDSYMSIQKPHLTRCL